MEINGIKYYQTDMGTLSSARFEYLYRLGFITNKGGIVGTTTIDGEEMNMWSIFCEILEDMKRKIQTNRIKIGNDIAIELMKEGEYTEKYQKEGQEYVETINYQKIESRSGLKSKFKSIRANADERMATTLRTARRNKTQTKFSFDD